MIKKEELKEYKKELIEVIHKIAKDKDKDLLNDFTKEVLTPHEFDNIAVRWQIVKRLAKGENHQSIAEDLHIGVSTVTRGSREMRKKDGGFHRALRLLGLE